MKNKKSVIVGIPAYNEELSLRLVLDSVLKQNTKQFSLKKIVVFSDASTDRTEEIAQSVKSKKVFLIRSKIRKGKTTGIKKLISYAQKEKIDILIILDADLRIKGRFILQKLIKKITEDKNIIAVSGFAYPLQPKTFMQKVGYFGFILWEHMVSKSGDRELYFRSSDPIIALRVNEFSSNRIKKYTYMHDEFYYLFAAKYKKKFTFEKNALVYFVLPKTFQDYKTQTLRYISSHVPNQGIIEPNEFTFNFSNFEKIKAFMNCLKKEYYVSVFYLFTHIYLHMLKTLGRGWQLGKWMQIKSTK